MYKLRKCFPLTGVTFMSPLNLSSSPSSLHLTYPEYFWRSRHCSNPFNFLKNLLVQGHLIAPGHIASKWRSQDSNVRVWLGAWEPQPHADCILPDEFRAAHWVVSPIILWKRVLSSFGSSSCDILPLPPWLSLPTSKAFALHRFQLLMSSSGLAPGIQAPGQKRLWSGTFRGMEGGPHP